MDSDISSTPQAEVPIPKTEETEKTDKAEEVVEGASQESTEAKRTAHEVEKACHELDQEKKDLNLFLADSIIMGYPMGEREVDYVKQRAEAIEALKADILAGFDTAEVREKGTEGTFREKLTAKRLSVVSADVHKKRGVASNLLDREAARNVFYIGDNSPVLKEAIATMDEPENVIGFEVTDKGDEISNVVTILYKSPEGELLKRSIITTMDEKTDAAIVFAAEGDIAGHAKRAAEVAKAVVSLGYEGQTYWVASGKYAELDGDTSQSIKHINLHDEPPGQPNEAIIKALEGEGNMHIWDDEKVKQRVGEYKQAFQQIVAQTDEKNVVLVSDFAPMADIAWKDIERTEGRRNDKLLTETHDVSMPPHRKIRSFKLFGAPVGEIAHRLNSTRAMELIDPQQRSYQTVNRGLNKAVDNYLGGPLHRVRQELGIDPQRGRSFRQEMQGRDGSITFGLDQVAGLNVGLLAEGTSSEGNAILCQDILEASRNRPVIYHNQGSTYDRDAFFSTAAVLSGMPDVFTVNATGSRTDIPEFTDRGLKIGQANDRFMTLGYAPGYDIVNKTHPRLVINQGGWGNISQTIQATSDRLYDVSSEILAAASAENPDTEQINKIIAEQAGVPRIISIPRTWEQENNARSLQEQGGHCEVLMPSDLTSVRNRDKVRNAVRAAIEDPVDPTELSFWERIHEQTVASEPAIHAALILERQALMQTPATTEV